MLLQISAPQLIFIVLLADCQLLAAGCRHNSQQIPNMNTQRIASTTEERSSSQESAPTSRYKTYWERVKCTGEHIQIRWQIHPQGNGTLQLDYMVDNASSDPVLILDKMVTRLDNGSYCPADDKIITHIGHQGTDIDFIRGDVEPYGYKTQDTSRVTPGIRRLPPGGTLSGRAVVSLPLRVWHPKRPSDPIEFVPSSLRLRIGYLTNVSTIQVQKRQLSNNDFDSIPVDPIYIYHSQLFGCGPPIPWGTVTSAF